MATQSLGYYRQQTRLKKFSAKRSLLLVEKGDQPLHLATMCGQKEAPPVDRNT